MLRNYFNNNQVEDDECDFMDFESFNAKYLRNYQEGLKYSYKNSLSFINQNIPFTLSGLKNESEKIILTKKFNADSFLTDEKINFKEYNLNKNLMRIDSTNNPNFSSNFNTSKNVEFQFSIKKYLTRLINFLLNKKQIKKVKTFNFSLLFN
jgi:hypothetical protein